MIVVNNNEVHEYAAEKMLQSVQNKFCHETAVALAGYLLGEVGRYYSGRNVLVVVASSAIIHTHIHLALLFVMTNRHPTL